MSFWSSFVAFSVVIGTIAGIIKILEYFGVKPQGVNTVSFFTSTRVVVVCMLLTWGAAAFDYYDRHKSPFPIWPHPYAPILVIGKTFRNEEVPLDGYRYSNCVFINVKFVYNGTTAIGVTDSKFDGPFVLRSENAAVSGTVVLMKWSGYLSPEFNFYDMLPNNRVEPIQR